MAEADFCFLSRSPRAFTLIAISEGRAIIARALTRIPANRTCATGIQHSLARAPGIGEIGDRKEDPVLFAVAQT